MRLDGDMDLLISFKRLVVLFQCYCLVGLRAQTQQMGTPTETKEYCPDDKFVASCGPGEVVLMETARYGRMKIGKCVTKNLGYLGCAVDVLRLIDSRCSGQERCEVSVMDKELRQLRPCPNDVSWYLEAGYRCVKVKQGDDAECRTKRHSTLTAESGYLASITSTLQGVGSKTCPWIIKAPPGQKINITMYNFISARTGEPGEKHPDVCYELAVLRDGSSHRSLTACSNELRHRVAHVSQTNEVTVEFLVKPSHGRLQFLLHYHAFGCGHISPPPGATAKRDGETMTVECEKSGETWFLTCSQHQWHGEIGNCSAEHTGTSTVTAQKTWGMKEVFGTNTSFPFGILIVVAVGVALGVFLGGTLLAFVSMYMKKKRHAREQQNRAPDQNHPFPPYSASEEDVLEERKMQSFADYSSKTLDSQTIQRDRDAYKHTVIPGPHPQYCTHPRGPHMYESPKFV